MKYLYLALAILGTILPYYALSPWLFQHGLALHLLLAATVAEPVGAFAWADVLISAFALLTFMWAERQRPIRLRWLPIVGLCCIGVSFALPMYLYLREADRPIPHS